MPLFYFDMDEGSTHTDDTEGLEFVDIDAACQGAMTALAEIARDRHEGCDGIKLTAAIRDEHGKTIFIARLLMTPQKLY